MASFHNVLPPTTRRYKYEGYDQCLRVLDQEAERVERVEDTHEAYNPYSIMEIDEPSFLECFVKEESPLSKSWEVYDHVSQSALLKEYSFAHAVIVGAFHRIFSAWADTSRDYIVSGYGATVRGKTLTKRPEYTWMPLGMLDIRSEWPTFVSEVVWLETSTKLQEDMKFWLDDPEGSVNAAISITVSEEKILVESWARRHNSPPSPNQSIEIVRNPSAGCPRVSGHLEIEFSDVVLRDKKDGESNFVMTPADMNELARHMW
ncbi:unnamed protein product [Penicillium nalgiovense]|uniref:Uncharacterized protein n=1 Tax=Penicillium nalgiovense TaxID=60175 RepID=A0A9W4I2K5_PENNA|nr:unnamed protein product [Penicillium nalgiovense]CAG7936153.1 unnamed protein product [Penicillium nalgiovense]CAG7937617.1 unnamed protein product [Penicillium nalgiovense]CAG7939111.1 unnamed protein product [Penicillium nalgiovense]CAG7940826.1 unnamed protein product [Penicillium nalgiovense]